MRETGQSAKEKLINTTVVWIVFALLVVSGWEGFHRLREHVPQLDAWFLKIKTR